jgi:hypothetical protein
MRLIGETRFRNYYRKDDKGSFEKASVTDPQYLWEALDGRRDPDVKTQPVVLMKGTARPPIPSVIRETTMRLLRRVPQGKGYRSEFRIVRRLWLGREHYQSGEGEKFAIILLPPRSGPRQSVRDAVADGSLPAWAETYVTRWAGDPTVQSALLPSDVPATGSIKSKLTRIDGVKMVPPTGTPVEGRDPKTGEAPWQPSRSCRSTPSSIRRRANGMSISRSTRAWPIRAC